MSHLYFMHIYIQLHIAVVFYH